jgi:flagellar hook-associated protein 2
MTMRITGLASGLDTESIITELTKVESKKVDKIKNDQKKHDMRMDKWKDLNKKVVSFYNKTLSNMRFDSSYIKKTTTSSNNDAVSITTSGSAMNSMQKMSVDRLASSAYMTSSKLKSKMGDGTVSNTTTLDNLVGYGSVTTDESIKNKVRIRFGPEPEAGAKDEREYVDIEIKGSETVAEALAKFKDVKSESGYGLNANFDSNQGRIYLTSTTSGEAGSFSIDYSATDMNVIFALGMNNSNDMRYNAGEDAQITLNGLEYKSNSNTFDINGLTITAKQVASDISLTTEDDTSGVYDMVKGFLKEYNELIGEMATYYNAESDKEYDILTAEQKESMTEEEIDEWNKKIEDGLLSKDATIGRVMREMKNIMLGSFDMGEVDKNGKPFKTSFASFGIATRSYFETEENDRGQWHIDGDEDDEYTSGKDDKLKEMIKNNSALVSSFFKQISKNMYSKIGDLMKSTEFSSAYTLYDDKTMKKQVDKYKTQLKEAQDKLGKVEDNYYKKFSNMEKAMTKLNEQTNSLAGMLGTG